MIGSVLKASPAIPTSLFNDSQLNPDISKLFESFSLLQETTKQVSDEATNTAAFLKDQLNSVTYRFFSVIDSITDLVIIKDGEGRWQTANKFAQKLFGFDPNKHKGLTDPELAIALGAEDLNQCPISDQKAWLSDCCHREIETFEVEGKIVHFDVIKTPTFNSDGSRKELIVIGRDITGYIESERRNRFLTAALNSASDNILLIDDNGIVNFCNDHFLKAFGFTSHCEIEGKPIAIISSHLMTHQFFDNMWKTIRNNEVWSDVIINRHLDGRFIKCFVTIIPIMNGKPFPIFYLSTMKTKILSVRELKEELVQNDHTIENVKWTADDEIDSIIHSRTHNEHFNRLVEFGKH